MSTRRSVRWSRNCRSITPWPTGFSISRGQKPSRSRPAEMMAEVTRAEATRAGPATGALLLEYTVKALVIAGLSELVLYRLISRLGMHLSKVAREYPVVEYFLRGASSLGFALLNLSAILVFLALFTFLYSKMKDRDAHPLDRLVVSLVSILLALTIV